MFNDVLKNFEMVVNTLKCKGLTISSMESCTGGGFASMITNVSGSSDVFSFGAVTYSNEYKVKMGVDKNVIDKFTVYSCETAKEMSRAIAEFVGSDFGLGITGKLKKIDDKNLCGEDDAVFISIFDRANNNYIFKKINVTHNLRYENKFEVLDVVSKMLINILKNYNN